MTEDTSVQAVEPAIAATNEVPNEAPDGTDTNALQDADSAPALTQPEDASEKPKGVQKRLDELTRNWRETERDRDYWRELAMRQPQQPESAPTPPPQPQEKLKTLEDFEFDTGKFTEYLTERALANLESKVQERRAAEERKTAQERAVTGFREREAAFSKEVEDYSEVAYKAPINEQVSRLVMELDEGPQVAYYLGKNPSIAQQLNQLPPSRAAMELGRIEARLGIEREKAQAAKKRVSDAPPPAPKVDAVEPAVNIRPDSPESDKLTHKEWLDKRNKQLAKRKQ